MKEEDITKFETEAEQFLLKNFAEAEYMKSVSKKARFYAALDFLKKKIEAEMDLFKKDLIQEKVEEYFVDDNIKVVYSEGASKSFIDSTSLYEHLKSEKRVSDFVEVATVSEKSLREKLPDGESLVAEFKVVTKEKNAPSVSVKALSKEDKKRLEEKSN
jgi:hypothetical protein